MKTILIADDSASARRLLETILAAAGYEVLSAGNGREALKLAFENDVLAVVSDEDMPLLKGSGLFRILKTDPEKQHIPCIAISGLTANDNEPVSEFSDAFISKDADLKSNLLAILEKLLNPQKRP